MSYVSRKYALSVCQRYERSLAFVEADIPLVNGVPYNYEAYFKVLYNAGHQ